MNAIEINDLLSQLSPGTQVLNVGEIEEDPNQPRQFFDVASLEELAKSIEDTAAGSATPWLHGLLHPIVVCPSPAWREGTDEPRWRVLVGARRLRAYRMRGWPVIPVRLVEAPANAARRLMTQMNENNARLDTTLWEDATAVATAFEAWKLEHRGGLSKDFAEEFRRSPTWVSQLLWVARSEGLTRQALIESRIRHIETARLFSKLALETQRTMLLEARSDDSIISRSPVARALREQESKAGTLPTSPNAGTESPTSLQAVELLPANRPAGGAGASPVAALSAGGSIELSRGLFAIVFTQAQVCFLLEYFGAQRPDNDDLLAPALYRAVADTMTQ